MEVVIPPRDRLRSSYRYTWDQNGDVMQVTRISAGEQQQPESRSGQQSQQPAATQRSRAGRQTVQWPFQSIATETDITSPTTSIFGRRATWGPRRILSGQSLSTTSMSAIGDLVPDYIVNYLRGETPETVARRQHNRRRRGRRGVDVEHQHRAHESRIAELDGFYEDGTPRSGRSSVAGGDEERQILRGSRGFNGGWRRLLVGWRGGVAMNVLLSLVILTAGIVCLIFAVAKVSVSAGESVIYSGSCETASHLNWGLHAVINILTVTLLAGANYVFQVLSSPTRAEVVEAHGRKKWLDIGIPSVRNFAYISGRRVCLAVIILLAALITQVIYNAVIFTSQTGINYRLLAVTESFLQGAPFSNATENNMGQLDRLDILALQRQAGQRALVNLTTTECLENAGGVFDSNFQAILLVADVESRMNPLVQTAAATTSPSVARVATVREKLSDLSLNERELTSCLGEPASGTTTCSVSLDDLLLGIVCIFNMITVTAVSIVLLRKPYSSPSEFSPLVSLGDAIRSFLREPDNTTPDSCLMSKTDVRQGRWGFREAKFWVPQDLFWLRIPSPSRWFLTSLFWVAPTGLAAATLILVLLADPTGGLAGFGATSARVAAVLPVATTTSAAALLAALPQLLLGALYLVVNSLLTTYHLSHESSLFALAEPRPLRVSSEPEGEEITSLYHTLPRPWSWFLVLLFAGMGFVLSQSMFAAIARFPDSSSSDSPPLPFPEDPTVTALGFSGTAILILVSCLLFLAITVLGQGLRRSPSAPSISTSTTSSPSPFQGHAHHVETPEPEPKPRPRTAVSVPGNPLLLPGGSCSAVISARCHPPPSVGGEPPWRLHLTWGVLLGTEDDGHDDGAQEAGRTREGRTSVGVVRRCAYTAGGIAPLEVGRSYA